MGSFSSVSSPEDGDLLSLPSTPSSDGSGGSTDPSAGPVFPSDNASTASGKGAGDPLTGNLFANDPLTVPGDINPYPDHQFEHNDAQMHENIAGCIVGSGPDPSPWAGDLVSAVKDYGNQGRGDVSDLLSRVHSQSPDHAAKLQQAMVDQGGERIPYATGDAFPEGGRNLLEDQPPQTASLIGPKPPEPRSPIVPFPQTEASPPAPPAPEVTTPTLPETPPEIAPAPSQPQVTGHLATKTGKDLLGDLNAKFPEGKVERSDSRNCVALVREAVPSLGTTGTWRPGTQITAESRPNIAPGTAIATFGPDGRYSNTSGDSHAAIFDRYGKDIATGREGIFVIDQSKKLGIQETFIPFDRGGQRGYTAGGFYVIR